MEKQIEIKKVLKIVFFILFFIITIFPLHSFAANELNWENPNSSNTKNPYEFNPKDVLNSQMIMQVIGCTGVVDKVSGAMMDFAKTQLLKTAKELILTDKMMEKAVKACEATKKGLKTSVVTIINMNWPGVVDEVNCKPTEKVKDVYAKQELKRQTDQAAANKKREECFNGIAIQLARNQLTSMARNTMNWVNTGFEGNPMYVQDITSFSNSIEKNILEKNIASLGSSNKAYPYGTDFSRSAINGYRTGSSFRSGGTNFLDTLTSDLGYFLTDPESYYGYSEKTAMERSQEANERFANDFSTGGWNGWLALTQRDQNNPLGFTMQASQYIADEQNRQTEQNKEELLTNNGFLSQKKCILWQEYLDVNIPEEELVINDDGSSSYEPIYNENKRTDNDQCVKYEVVTPGSIIKDKLTTYINSPERQLELADTINESLNSLFSALISKFQNQGLASLSSGQYEYTTNGRTPNTNMGLGYGSQDAYNLEFSSYSAGAGYLNGSFDLTRDLGNIYIHDYNKNSLGDWNAKLNIIENTDPVEKLYVGLGPIDKSSIKYLDNGLIDKSSIKYLTNVYFTVKTAGSTKLFNDGFNGWAVGDRAFWNGKEWQNWKKGTDNPIDKKGVIQTQYDYIVAAKEMLSSLPNIMPKIGELDYCIPGPNPSWEANSGEAESLFLDYANSIGSSYKDNTSWFDRDKTTFTIAQPGNPIYDNYKAIFNGTHPNLWQWVKENFSELQRLGKDEIANDQDEANRQNEIANLLEGTNSNFVEFHRVAKIMFEKLYGPKGFLQTEFLEKENTSELIPNPSFLPMATEGLKITKNILSYDEEIKTAREEYRDAIDQANTNISKLNAIKLKVSNIINAAQTRRDEYLLGILNDETIKECSALSKNCLKGIGKPPEVNDADLGEYCLANYNICISDTMTEVEYQNKYKECLEEEDILYYDDTGIMNVGEGERCYDEFDNDLDGLIDMLDPDCAGNTGGNNTVTCLNGANNPPRCSTLNGECLNGAKNPPFCDNFSVVVGKYCKIDPEIPPTPSNMPNNVSCVMRQTEFECEAEPYYKAGSGRVCYWDGPSI